MDERPWHHAYDPGVPRELDYEPVAVHDFLRRTAARFPDRVAIRFANARITYRELQEDADRLATALAGMGVGPGSRVAIMLPNVPQTAIAYYAVLSLGATVVLTNPLYSAPEVEHQWKDAGCELAVVADFVWMGELRPVRESLPIRRWIVASIPEYLRPPLRWIAPFALKRKKRPAWARVPSEEGVHRFRALVRATRPAPPRPEVSLDDLAVLQYTGGTTGRSKGAMLTHRNLSCNVQQTHAWFTGVEEGGEVVLTALPLFHVFGMTVAMNWPVRAGATMVFMADPRDVGELVSNLEDERVTILPAVPAMFNAVTHFEGVEGRDLSSVKACFSGSAPLPIDVMERFEALTGARILEGFGLTETSPVTHVNPLGGERKAGTIGIPVPDTDARVVDADEGTRDVPEGEPGELVIRGPQVMGGYWNMPEETADSLRDGWFHTGDLATMDEDGYFAIVGRKKDMIIAGGYKVYPDEVDQVLAAHPDVLEAATIGVPHERRGETVKSFVVPRPGKRPAPDELEAWCRERLAAYKVPRSFELLDELPKSTVMKVLRRELREREIARQSAAPDAAESA